jgi:CDGSH-type Zn-finger protein
VQDEPTIQVTEDGPYAVLGGLPVAPGRIVKTELGEPVEWDIGEPYATGKRVDLCRCGRSKTKPFCDDSHLEGFDGTETASREPSAGRRRTFPAKDVALTDDISICSHAGFCRDVVTDVWSRLPEAGNPEVRAKIEAIAARCPSGRLGLIDRETDGPIEPAFEPGIVVEENGPYCVRGGVRVRSEDGTSWETRNRMTLCRCGGSANKPFCDGTHDRIGFRG